jgi:hypothetical protein
MRRGARYPGHRRAAGLAAITLLAGLLGATATAGLVASHHVVADNGVIHSDGHPTIRAGHGSAVPDDNGVIHSD